MSYCPYCYANRIYNRSIYCPLDAPTNVPASALKKATESDLEWITYDPSNLPMRTDEQSRRIADHIVKTGDDKTAKKYGVRGPCCLSQLLSIDIPRSFPPDAMHLWWENVIPDLVKHWRGKFFSDTATAHIIEAGKSAADDHEYEGDSEFQDSTHPRHGGPSERDKGLKGTKGNSARGVKSAWGNGRQRGRPKGKTRLGQEQSPSGTVNKKFVKTNDPFNVAPEQWTAIAADMAESSVMVPATFGDPIRNFAENCHHLKAAEWKIFTLLLAPIYLKNRLSNEDYAEFLNLIDAIHLCCDYEISVGEINVIEFRLKPFVQYCENRYYGRLWEKLPACLPVIHQILHVAHGICWA